ncbi:Crp/Fnr family transcriptional regulator [Denitrobaculum tricleocarpae]|uniref:Crp/Fnr family transcriptional regulator n=1 Tax=Denitrobaculum tricleocarpae TaxID=2591009 RepID=A0A545T091_9PROT|nr:Crp/Fnr family transcriptional regulator [Denitrobaculum tricleocarpae]TQV70620.1 Crp/Fnr family transcriptional regulator [Denitrobaculum tricleocarpae]
MDKVPRVLSIDTPCLPDYSPWNRLSAASLCDLLDTATPANLSRGDEVRSDVGIVISGAFAVQRELSDGRRVLCSLFHEGDLVDVRRSERIRQGKLIALKDSEFLMLDQDQIDACIAQHSDIAGAFITQQGAHFARMRDHVTDLSCKTPFERLASLLFEFKRWPGRQKRSRDGDTVHIPIMRIDIADYIGVKAETVSRAIRKLEQEKRIAIPTADQVFMIDVPAMRQIANGGRPRQSTRRA